LDLGYVPHYYGPYSPKVASALENLVSLGLVREDARWTQREHRIYSYSLTDDGAVVLDNVERTYPMLRRRHAGRIQQADMVPHPKGANYC
jgi:uncharacterized protein YwgA